MRISYFCFYLFSLSAQSSNLFCECMKPMRRRSREQITDLQSKSVAKSCETLTNVDVVMTYVFDDRVVVLLSTSTIYETHYTSFITGYQGINNHNVFNMITIFRVHPVINSGRFLFVRTITFLMTLDNIPYSTSYYSSRTNNVNVLHISRKNA